MKIAYMSDLHLEFRCHQTIYRGVDYEWDGYTYLPYGPKLRHLKNEGIDVFVLAGDIGTYAQHFAYAEELSRYLDCEVVSVIGNHEWYGETYCYLLIPSDFSRGERHHMLHRSGVIIDGVRFLGCTLWTDFNATHNQRFVMDHVADITLADFHQIRGMTPDRMLTEHSEDYQFLMTTLDDPFEGKTVVVTHNSPISGVRNPNYPMDDRSACFVSDCDELVESAADNGVHAWFYGHDHWSQSANVYGVDICSAQVGYPGENSNWRGVQIYEL
jgi:DNA repair exonuclease SbcCD nuclease subunit